MKIRSTRFWYTDQSIIALLALSILGLALGTVRLNHAIQINMLRTHAQSTAATWVNTLLADGDVVSFLSGQPASAQTEHFLRHSTQLGKIYRCRLWNQSGQLLFSSERYPSLPGSAAAARYRNQQIARALQSKSVLTEVGSGTSPENPAYFTTTYVPVINNGSVLGVFEVYTDEGADEALYQESFLVIESSIAIAVLLAGGIPGVMAYRKMLAHRTAQAKALYLAQHDSLTGLLNRTRLTEEAKKVLALAARHHRPAAVLLFDLNRFKEINDSLGHAAGDSVLKEFAVRLAAARRPGDIVARLGGDEFVLLRANLQHPNEARVLAGKLKEMLEAPCTIGDLPMHCTASMGVALAPADAQDWDALLTCADAALYLAKKEGRDTPCFYEAGMDGIFRRRHQLESDMRRALETNAFQLAYQPFFSFRDGSLLGFEALLRWPEGWGPESPAEFIPLAEETGLITRMGAWVLETACQAAAGWTRPVKIAINLSPVQFRQGDIVAVVEKALADSGLDPARLELEVTERLWLRNTDAVLSQLAQLRALGASIALDDFGTGYSSLTYLWKFPFDTVKIDRSFVSELKRDAKADAIVHTIAALGKTLALTVTAEGVETQVQAQALLQAGCDQAQGYLFGRPLSAVAAHALVDKERHAAGFPVRDPGAQAPALPA